MKWVEVAVSGNQPAEGEELFGKLVKLDERDGGGGD